MPVIYFHGASEGLKIDLLRKDNNVCVEADNFIKVEKTLHGITTRYESIIGFGKCEIVSDHDEIIKGLKLIVSHYEQEYDFSKCENQLGHLFVGKIIFETITGKRNLN